MRVARLRASESFRASMDSFDLKNAVDGAFAFLDALNKFVDTKKPWAETDQATNLVTLHTVGMGLANVAIWLRPFFPVKMAELLGRIGLDPVISESELPSVRRLSVSEKGEPLYARKE